MLSKIWEVPVLVLCVVSVAFGQEVKTIQNSPKAATDPLEWRYEMTLKRPQGAKTFSIQMNVPDAVVASAVFTDKDRKVLTSSSRKLTEGAFNYEWDVTYPDDVAETSDYLVQMRLAGDPTKVKPSGARGYKVCPDGGHNTCFDGTIAGPEVAFDESRFQPIVGASVTVRRLHGGESITFKTEQNTLIAANDSRLQPSFVVGGLFKLYNLQQFDHRMFKVLRTLDSFITFDFSPGNNSLLDSVTFGGATALTPYFEFFVGWSVGSQPELRPAFKRAAALFVEQQGLTDRYPLNADKSSLADINLFDGLSLADSQNRRFYAGDPTINRYRSRVTIGFLFPVDFKRFFSQTQ